MLEPDFLVSCCGRGNVLLTVVTFFYTTGTAELLKGMDEYVMISLVLTPKSLIPDSLVPLLLRVANLFLHLDLQRG